ncbi:hypothetical protein P171DRAFT_478819 [Karstenula rhodostoma CBS 690.94]|uniref:Zn(2)-C6 fungal-type domain-containing protein n=1 Tax=Karstenula rhodostoma CBS 690.94 TaxID=1392251 RepID=A0A9P4PUV0_9PLEO|nr:hypothetical protein P171DRAFT_478819 [Karstenula rhodostoma CBS 690.94]
MPKSRARPDPVSCEFCRTKKLKCSRVQPCSNCVARGITCRFLVPPSRERSAVPGDSLLLSRIEQLESAISSLQQQLRTENGPTSAPSAQASSDYASYPTSGTHDYDTEDVGYLENIGTRDDTLLCDMSDSLEYEIISLSEILASSSYNQDKNSTRSVIRLPPFGTGSLLLHTYETKLLSICPIVYIPTIRSLLRTTYLRLKDPALISPSSVAVLSALFALGAFFCDPSSTSEIATTEADSIALSKAFSRNALDLLDHSRRTSSGTLEDVQAYILMSLALSHIDGFSARSRMLFSSALCMARDLRLHRLDKSESSADAPYDARLLVEKEIKRRVFWYIASEDWLQSTISGPQEGTYSIQHSQIKVNLPQDCTDDELALGDANGSTFEDAPTDIMVFLERIRLAHICREITDTLPLETVALLQMPYGRIVALDQKLEQFLATMPHLLQHHCSNKDILESMYPQLPSWRYCITKAALSRRWKLNQAFLLRQNLDPRYSYSRRACVESAHAVIAGYTSLFGNNTTSTLLTRMGIAIHFTHLALSILIMDLCFNRPQKEVARTKEDIKAAFKIFGTAKTVSPLLAKSLVSLKAVLQRNHIDLTDAFPSSVGDQISNGDDAGRSVSGATGGETSSSLNQNSYQDVTMDATFDTFWDYAVQIDGGMDLDEWDHLFSTLDTRPI